MNCTTPLRLSNSSLETIAACDTKALLSCVYRLTSPTAKLAMYCGECFHQVLAAWYKGQIYEPWEAVAMLEKLSRTYADDNVKLQEARLQWENVKKIVERYFESHPVSIFPFEVFADYVEMAFDGVALDEKGEFTYSGIVDLLVRDRQTGGYYVVDHKTTGWLSSLWIKQWPVSAQMTGYQWAIPKWFESAGYRLPLVGVWINGIEIARLPNSERKCKVHRVPYAECSKYHANFQMIGPMSRPPHAVESWRLTAITLGRKLKWLIETFGERSDLERYLPYLNTNGVFTKSCSMYGGCEFVDWCSSGRRVDMLDRLFVARPESLFDRG